MSFPKKSDVKSHFSPRNNGEVHLFLSVKNQEETYLSEKKDDPVSAEQISPSTPIELENSARNGDVARDSTHFPASAQSVKK
ncbi:hypothetical protein ACOBR2_06340 [Telmatobacter bradus]|uniref:hypothetical protein n=1 Tax=Telmatobacter bradus TaxID=474953 RepID=UPI003B432EBB